MSMMGQEPGYTATPEIEGLLRGYTKDQEASNDKLIERLPFDRAAQLFALLPTDIRDLEVEDTPPGPALIGAIQGIEGATVGGIWMKPPRPDEMIHLNAVTVPVKYLAVIRAKLGKPHFTVAISRDGLEASFYWI
jgi:hypothetical protein